MFGRDALPLQLLLSHYVSSHDHWYEVLCDLYIYHEDFKCTFAKSHLYQISAVESCQCYQNDREIFDLDIALIQFLDQAKRNEHCLINNKEGIIASDTIVVFPKESNVSQPPF